MSNVPGGNKPAEDVNVSKAATQPVPEAGSTRNADASHGTNGRIVWRRLLQRKLMLRVTIPTAIGLVQLAFSIYAIIFGNARPIILLFMLPALLVGYFFGRRTKIGWDDDSEQVSLIQAQVLLAVSYIVVRVGTRFLLEKTLDSRISAIATVLLIVSFGLFFGRSLGLAEQIWHALVNRSNTDAANPNPPQG